MCHDKTAFLFKICIPRGAAFLLTFYLPFNCSFQFDDERVRLSGKRSRLRNILRKIKSNELVKGSYWLTFLMFANILGFGV